MKSARIAILVIGLCGCRPDAETGRTTIDFWAIGSEGENVQVLVRDFEVQNPDIRVRVQQMPWTAAHEKLLTAFAGDATPDVCQLGNTWIPELATLGALEPLDARVAGSDTFAEQDFFVGLWETNRLDDQLYGIPWYADTRVLFYRKDLLANAGWDRPPQTWDEWLAAMRDVKRTVNSPAGAIISAPTAGGGKAIIASRHRRAERFAMLIPTNEWEQPTIFGLQTGAEMLRDGGRYGNFRSPEFRRAFEFYVRLFEERLSPASANTEISNVWEEFARGYFAMYITGPWNIGEFRRRLPPEVQDQWATAPLPRPDADRPSISQAGGCGLVIFRQSLHQDAAWRLIEFLSQPAQQVRFYELTGNLPTRESAWQLGRLAEDARVAAFHDQLENVRPLPRVPEWEQITTKIIQAGQMAIAGRKSIDQALTDLDRTVDAMLEKRRWMLARQEMAP